MVRQEPSQLHLMQGYTKVPYEANANINNKNYLNNGHVIKHGNIILFNTRRINCLEVADKHNIVVCFITL